jgi:predicted secreted protein
MSTAAMMPGDAVTQAKEDLLDAVVRAFTTRNQTAAAAMGTDTYLLTRNSSSALATPAKLAMTLVRFARTSSAMSAKVMRSPNSSRMRSDRPLPVTAPIRAFISCVTTSRSAMGGSVHRSM